MPSRRGAVADFNGDNNLDIAVLVTLTNGADITGYRLDFILGNGDGTFGNVAGSLNIDQLSRFSVVAGDINNDLRADIILKYIRCDYLRFGALVGVHSHCRLWWKTVWNVNGVGRIHPRF